MNAEKFGDARQTHTHTHKDWLLRDGISFT